MGFKSPSVISIDQKTWEFCIDIMIFKVNVRILDSKSMINVKDNRCNNIRPDHLQTAYKIDICTLGFNRPLGHHRPQYL